MEMKDKRIVKTKRTDFAFMDEAAIFIECLTGRRERVSLRCEASYCLMFWFLSVTASKDSLLPSASMRAKRLKSILDFSSRDRMMSD